MFGGPRGGFGEGMGRFGGICETAQVSLEQRDPSGERFEGTHGGPGEGLGRFGGTYAVVAVAGRGGVNSFFFFTVFPADSLGVAAAAR